MSQAIDCLLIFLLFIHFGNLTCSWKIQETKEKLDEFIKVSQRVPRDSMEEPIIWMNYEFNSGAGNREEILITNISIYEELNLPATVNNWQALDINNTVLLFRTERSVLWFYRFNSDDIAIEESSNINVNGVISTYKVFNLYPENEVIIVLCVETIDGTLLQWYRLIDGKSCRLFWSWPVQKHIKKMKLIQQDETNKLLLINEEEVYFNYRYTPIDVYGFSIDFPTNAFHFWLCQRTMMPRAFDIQVCSIYETVSLAVRNENHVYLYEYRNTTEGSIFQEFQRIKSQNLRHLICFESGYLQFLAISGSEAALRKQLIYLYEEDEFVVKVESEPDFDYSEIVSLKDLRLETYRDESLLLIQLRNSTMIAMGWQGSTFKKTQLPGDTLNRFNLSSITPIPKFGFVSGNSFVKFHTELKRVKHPVQSDIERLLVLQRLLNDTLNHQEKILQESKDILDKSYLLNPVINGFWNLSTVNATNVTISDQVKFQSVTVGSINLTKEELKLDTNDFMNRLENVQRKLEEIDKNIKNAVDSNSTELRFDSDVKIIGNITITGNLTVQKLMADSINDMNRKNHSKSEENTIYESIEAENLTIYSLNGIPIENIHFTDSMENFTNLNLTETKKIHVRGHLSFSTINGIDWDALIKSIVWKDKAMFVPGNTIIQGTLTADSPKLSTLNNLLYPDNYIFKERDSPAIVTGRKSFEKLETPRLGSISKLNGIDFEDFIILHKENVLKEEITFENLIVEGPFQVDGKITGLNLKENQLLNETTKISSDVLFINLNVLGNVTFDTLLLSKSPLNFGDLLSRNEENVKITGTKTFLGNVKMMSNVTITSEKINGHYLNEFVTLDTDQDFPNLRKISSNVTFGNVTFGMARKFETLFNSTSCLDKIILFEHPITVNELSFDQINHNVSYNDFIEKLNETFRNTVFDNLIVENLYSDKITPGVVNGLNFTTFMENVEAVKFVNNYTVDILETDGLNVSYINGMSLEDVKELKNKVEEILEKIQNGSVTLEKLKVSGKIKANSINGVSIKDLYDSDKIRIIFKEDISVKNLTILGFINGYNFSELISDTVLKTDTDIIIDGYKIFDTVNCHLLDIKSLNGKPVENILDPLKDQELSGPVTINGSITVSKLLNITGKIGEIPFHDFRNRFKILENNSYEYNGDVIFPENVTIENLQVNGLVQGKNLTKFFESVIFKTEDNVTITGTKIFQNKVTFHDAFVVRDKLNNVDLKRFHEKAVFIDKPFSIRSKIIFSDEIEVQRNLKIQKNFQAKSLMNIDMEELQMNVLYLNRPSYVEGVTTFRDVTFQSDVKMDIFNNLDMSLLIPLRTDQIMPVVALTCRNVTVEELNILGKINGEDFRKIQENTFMITGDQNITGHFHFPGKVQINRDFNPNSINGIDPTKFIPLNTKNPIKGNFLFEETVYFNETLRILNHLNDIDLNRWEAVAVTKNNKFQQIISGKWTIFGNVYFKNGTYGSDLLNGINITEMSSNLKKEHLEIDSIIKEKNRNLASICEDLRNLKYYAEKQIYQFNTFDYLQIIDFQHNITSVHYFELDDLDYIMISLDSCTMYTYLFNETKFELVANISNFGVIEKWTTFRHDRVLYFLTKGPNVCARNSVNLWKLSNEEFEHVLDLGYDIDGDKINPNAFLRLLARRNQMRSVVEGNDEFARSLLSLKRKNNVKIILEDEQMLLTSKEKETEKNIDNSNDTNFKKYVRGPETLNFKAGLLKKEMFLYYDEEISKDRIFICTNDSIGKRIVQTIWVHRPSSFSILNFDGSIETMLVFLDNKKYLRMYEYKGIKGFLYKDSIRMNAEKLISLKIRKYANMARRYCLALINDNKLSILEAKMFGEKLDMKTLSC